MGNLLSGYFLIFFLQPKGFPETSAGFPPSTLQVLWILDSSSGVWWKVMPAMLDVMCLGKTDPWGETYLFTIGGCVLLQLDFLNLSHVVATKTWSELVSKSRSCLNLRPHRFLVSSLGSVWRWEVHVRGFTASLGSIQAYNIIAGNQPCMFHCISR